MGRLLLDARRAVYLVKVGETFYVLGASEAGLTKLGELDRATLGDLPQAGEGPGVPRSFKEFLNRLQTEPGNRKSKPAGGPDGG